MVPSLFCGNLHIWEHSGKEMRMTSRLKWTANQKRGTGSKPFADEFLRCADLNQSVNRTLFS